ncbi:unnamed protein product [Echinostoma caproni]|uniref:ATP-dependent RNA helicase n=1 Tax=Echinostoma caproni TaxID=27848 RepID=A0A183BCR6_9TREM|nr:unnamed protein product [Echinostoma caproni]
MRYTFSLRVNVDRRELAKRFREPPGIIKNNSEENKFLATDVHATLSGIPTTQDFSYGEITSISDIPHLDYRLYENLSRMGLDQLTPVQRHAIGIMSIDETATIQGDSFEYQRVVGKYDLMAAAQTGSGKTLAYLIPIVNRLLRVYPYEAMQARVSW